MKIILQAGHEGRTSGSTGAPNEQSFNIDICNKVADEMRSRGVEVRVVGADPLPAEISGDWDLFLAIHYDADVYGKGGGFVDYPEPSTDGATVTSQRLAYLLRQEYFGTTGIVNHPERSNKNTRYYYMWKSLSAKTPCVIIECGVGMHSPDDHEILHFNRPKVIEGIVKGLCLGLGVEYIKPPQNVSVQPTIPPIVPPSTVTPELPVSTPSINSAEVLLEKVRAILYGKPRNKITLMRLIIKKQ